MKTLGVSRVRQQRLRSKLMATVAVAVVVLFVRDGDAESPVRTTAEQLLQKYQNALVHVEATVQVKMELVEGPPEIGEAVAAQPPREQSTSTDGVIVDAAGIIAVPLAGIDPTRLTQEGINLGPAKIALKGSITSVKVIDGDGSELEARVALEDAQRGIVLLKLSDSPDEPMTFVAVAADQQAPQPFAQMLMLERLSVRLGNDPIVSLCRFVQQLPGPVRLYDMSGTVNGVGFVVFDVEEKFQGMGVIPLRKGAAGDVPLMLLPPHELAPLIEKVKYSE